jgi:hypothetical protein
MRQPVTIYNGKSKRIVIGFIEDGVFYKEIKGSIHILRKLDAIGIDAHIFKTVIEPNLSAIVVRDSETGISYTTTPEIIKKKGEYRHYKPHRAQVFLARVYWTSSYNNKLKEINNNENL